MSEIFLSVKTQSANQETEGSQDRLRTSCLGRPSVTLRVTFVRQRRYGLR